MEDGKMAEVNMKKAKEVYKKLVGMLEKHGWSFDRHDDDLVISSGVKGDDLRSIIIYVPDRLPSALLPAFAGKRCLARSFSNI